ncbi:MAG: sulfate ABC transporter permease subunit CysW [Planctomycetes bacterium]|nr:sulfate ABC transporter permease subunit CysW [Rhodospirillales bacterium]MBN9120088.1 sulfate ABC transporter permease subunit CysW [Planctomycetota bacterium]
MPSALTPPRLQRAVLILLAVTLMGVLLLLPLVVVFSEALSQGFETVVEALETEDARAAIELTLLVAAITVPLNTVCGMAAAWCLARFQFPGRTLLATLVELPFSVSPVISGLVWVLLFGANGWFGPWLDAHGVRIIFALPGLVLATTFVTFPFVARALIPLMRAQGPAEEEAALTLGANAAQVFWHVTLPNIRWALMYGVLLCNARAMGEFGAVAVVSGHIRGQTLTMPLYVEALFNDYDWVGAFTVAALLSLLALVTLGLRVLLERHMDHGRGAA